VLNLPVFATTLFVSAFLLFAIQPMFTKMVLPKLGGSPGVWSVAMVFFQSVLLAGYAYAHCLATWFSVRRAALIHIAVMAVVLASALPIGLATGFGRPPVEGEAWWLMGLFAASVGLPFFALSANGPLLQAWFARTGHPHARDPYFLYGSSNFGSLLALLSYPLLVEPLTTLGQQGRLWTWGFAALIALIACCASFVASGRAIDPAGAAQAMDSDPGETAEPVTSGQRATWTALAFVPSALLVAVTAHISTDVAAAPFLWVVPLSLFLVTFIITFQRQPVLSHALMLRLQPIVLALPIISVMGGITFGWGVMIVTHLAAFFVTAMVCHGELVRRRPSSERLTEFYMFMSFGGVLGGLFAGLLSPLLFNWVAEYPLLIVAGLLCRPGLRAAAGGGKARREAAAIVVIGLVLIVPGAVFGSPVPLGLIDIFRFGIIAAAGLFMLQGDHPLRLVALAVSLLLVTGTYAVGVKRAETIRSFFGVNKIFVTVDGQFRVLSHGTTIHGAMRVRDRDGNPVTGRPVPTTYYTPDGPIAQSLNAVRDSKGRLDAVAIIGVGSGTLACYKKPGENWTFFEIDAGVVRIARDPARFRFVSECAPDAMFRLGDARLTIADAADKSIDMLVVDAFSSDAIPVHLLTREAVALYVSKLKDDGVAALHISNRNMELASVVAAVAAEQGLTTWVRQSIRKPDQTEFDTPAIVAVIARDPGHVGALATTEGWARQEADPKVAPWTDDYANIIAAIWRRVMQ